MQNNDPSSMGLRGLWAATGNASAMVLIGVMLWTSQRELAQQAREDRTLCQQQLQSVQNIVEGAREDLRAIHRTLQDRRDDAKGTP